MVYILLADGFEEIEALETVDILRRCGIGIQTVGVNAKTVTGSHNITVTADIEFDDVVAGAMEMLILPGGPGHEVLDADDRVHALINYCMKYNKYIAAICAAPSILGKRGILDGKNAVCFPGYEEDLHGAILSGEKAVKDGKIITARGAGAASEFAFMAAAVLKDEKTAEKVKRTMQF